MNRKFVAVGVIIVFAMFVSIFFNMFVLSKIIDNLILRTILNLISGWTFGVISAKYALSILGYKTTFKEMVINHKYLFKVFFRRR